jgi:hypothetical protein
MSTTPQQHRTPRPPAIAIAEANDVFGSRKFLRSQELIEFLGRGEPDFRAQARELLNIELWTDLPSELPEVRYVWQMLEKLLPGRRENGHDSADVRLALAERALQLCEDSSLRRLRVADLLAEDFDIVVAQADRRDVAARRSAVSVRA